MTEAEELEMLQLKKRKAIAAQAPPSSEAGAQASPVDPPSAARSAALGFGQFGSFGASDEIGGLVAKFLMGDGVKPGAGAQPAPDDTPEVRAAKEALLAQTAAQPSTYETMRNSMRGEDASAREHHPWQYWGGALPGAVASGALLPGAGALRGAPMLAARGAPLTQNLGRLMVQGSKVGALGGALGGLGQSQEQTLGGMLKDTAIGGAGGAVLGAGLPVLGRVGQGGVRFGRAAARGGYVQPTPEALRLAQEGVDLTVGQMNPSSVFGQTEELASNTVTGGPLTSAREKAAASTRDAILRKVAPPSAKPPTRGASVGEQIKELKAGFSQLYDEALEGAPLTPEKYIGQGKWRGLVADETLQGGAKTKGAFDLAAADRSIDATPRVRDQALTWLRDQAEALLPRMSGPDAGKVDARAVQALRTRLRDRVNDLGGEGDDRALAQIYGRAEEFVTELLEGQLPPARAAMLREADASYRNLMAVKDAAKRAFVQNEEFTPAQLLQAIRSKGATPELEAVARDAQAVLSPTYTPTGLQSAAVAGTPGYKYFGPAWANAVNSSPRLRSHALRETGQKLQAEGAARLSDLLPSPQPSLMRLLQPDRLGGFFPMNPSEAR